MPTFKTPPDLDSSSRSPYDDLNRLDRDKDRNGDRHSGRQPERGDDRNGAELRVQDRLDRVLERAPEPGGREADQYPERSQSREPERGPAKSVQPASRNSNDAADPLIQGLFSKLPEPSTEWPLPARQKWLQTAANIFDLMYAPGEADAGELAIRVERNSTR
jgi:hypothetical protein